MSGPDDALTLWRAHGSVAVRARPAALPADCRCRARRQRRETIEGLIVAVRRHVFVYDWGSAKGRQLFVDFIAGLLSSGQADGIFSDKWNCALDRALLLPPRVG